MAAATPTGTIASTSEALALSIDEGSDVRVAVVDEHNKYLVQVEVSF